MANQITLEELSQIKLSTRYSYGDGGTLVISQEETFQNESYKISEEFQRKDWHELVLHGFLYQAQQTGNIDGKRGWNRKYFGGRFSSGQIPEDMNLLQGIVSASHVPLVMPNGGHRFNESGEHIFFIKSKTSNPNSLYPGITHRGDLVYIEPRDMERIKLKFNYDEAVRFTIK